MKDYRELEVWRTGHALALEIYISTKAFPREELFGLTGQMRRAAASIPANIAEGCGRFGDPELRRYLNIALGSACELDYFVLLCRELGYLKEDNGRSLASTCLLLRRQLGGFIKKLGTRGA